MNDEVECIGIAVIVLLILSFILFIGAVCGHNYSYKRGQVDAITGKIKYKLIEHVDKSTTWEWINENKH